MYGAILGDIIGSPYEFDRGNKTKEFPLFHPHAKYTDDTVMTVAVADALMCTMGDSDEDIRETLIDSMHNWGHKYPYAGYGGRFAVWLERRDREPYNSYGNGSAMRVSAAGWLYDTLEKTRAVARLTAEVTHNHPEGIQGRRQRPAPSFWPGRAARRMKYGIPSFGNSGMIFPGLAMRFVRDIIMWKAVRRRFRKL